MSRRKNEHYPELARWFAEYCNVRSLDFYLYSPYHMRIMDGGFTVFDAWTTARYYILTTDFVEKFGVGYIERGGEKGSVPLDKKELFDFLDRLFYVDEYEKPNEWRKR